MIHSDKFVEKLINLTLMDALAQRKGYARLDIEGTTYIKAQRFLSKFGYSIINDNGFFEIVPDEIKELQR